MILSELAREEGVFNWIAEVAATQAKGSPKRLFLLIYLAGTVVTTFLSNDATAVMLTPAVLTIVRRLKVEPVPHLLACALIANAASFVLPISNPANLVIFDQHIPVLFKWLGFFLVPSLVSITITFLALRYVSKSRLQGDIIETLTQTKLSKEGRLAFGGLMIAAVFLVTASALGLPLGAPTCVAALLATAVVAWSDRGVPIRIARGVRGPGALGSRVVCYYGSVAECGRWTVSLRIFSRSGVKKANIPSSPFDIASITA